MSTLSKVSLIGSCRLQNLFVNNYPPRLHAAREILFFLKNLEKIKNRIQKFSSIYDEDITMPEELLDEYRFLCTLHGDCVHKHIYKDTVRFWEKPDSFFRSNFFLIEVSSLSHLRSKNGIGSVFYNKKYKLLNCKNSLVEETSLPELKRQINDIYSMLQSITGHLQDIKLFFIPIVDLPLSLGEERVPQRKAISDSLRDACQEFRNIEFCPIWDDVRSSSKFNLSAAMVDKYHYSQDLQDFVGDYLESYFREKFHKDVLSKVEFCNNTSISQDLLC